MIINDNEILHKIIEIQGCVIQGRSFKALLHRNIDFYLEKSGADVITVYMNEHEEVNIECVLERHRHFAHLMKKYLSNKKKLDWKTFVKECSERFNPDLTHYRFDNLSKLFGSLLNHKESRAFSDELQMKEAVMMPLYAFDMREKIGYICFIFKQDNSIDMDKLNGVRILFQTLLQPLYDSDHNLTYSKCARIDENMRMLTEQEKRIARKVMSGYSYPQIAEDLEISINTLKTHMKHIFNKYEVTSKIELHNKLSTPL
jgi:DNA-binding CsgD family transcriptional regulator